MTGIILIVLFSFAFQLQFQSGNTLQALVHGGLYRIQNNYNDQYLTACLGGKLSDPTCVQTGPKSDGSNPNREQIWEINEADIEKSHSTKDKPHIHHFIRSLKYMYNNVTFERKICPMNNQPYTTTITYLPVPVDEDATEEDTLWYFQYVVRHGCQKKAMMHEMKCLTHSNGLVENSKCDDQENQQWRLTNVTRI